MDFFIDTGKDEEVLTSKPALPSEIYDIVQSVRNKARKLPVIVKPKNEIDEFAANLAEITKNKKIKKARKYDADLVLNNVTVDSSRVNNLVKQSVLNDKNFEFRKKVPQYDVSEKKAKRLRKYKRERTKGKHWFNLPATEVTEEVKRDLEILQMRSVLDPKHFYKKNDMKVLPKYFQIGKVMDSPLDYYNNRCTKKERKRTMVDELLADAEFVKYNKKKYVEIVEERRKTNYKAYQQAKRLKRKNRK